MSGQGKRDICFELHVANLADEIHARVKLDCSEIFRCKTKILPGDSRKP
jgi:hypothetical protein